jgi:uncharacterized protein YoxC
MLAESNNPMPSSAEKAAAAATWSPETETALLLHLCEAQMDAAMRDSDQSVDVLVHAFTELAQASQALNELAKQLPAAIGNARVSAELNRRADEVSKQINDAIVAFQFYDKLSQRLGHVRHSLTTLAMFVCNRTQTSQREHWLKLLTSLRRLYRTVEERAVFDLVAEGATADEVRASINEAHQYAAASSVELF